MADADQPFRENVDQESSQELVCGNRHDLLLTAPCVVFPAKRDSIILESNEPVVQRELARENAWHSYSTKKTYGVYLKRWVIPYWGKYQLSAIRTIEVESWLRRLPLANGSCTKIRNVMSALFNHACRYEFFDRNPICLVRQSAKRRTAPSVLTPAEIKALTDGLALRERTLVLIAASTCLRQSEVFGLRWGDIDFAQGSMNVTRSIVYGVVGPCKTESSQKPVPFHPLLADALSRWQEQLPNTYLPG